ncbi:relaxase/mobilization nuclease domain-containing protein [Streptomyces sp. NPDC091272]|uniref:relaxase/mobilization nuclease domain-containing protein n=1 Tax=Streptomyces sp. NPDC091272 TaxID=3365981 RepID=UPI0038217B2C
MRRVVPDISTGNDTRGLLAYAFGPGRRDEHLDPHLVAAWDMAGAPDPGHDPTATVTQLAKRLDQYVTLATRERGAKPANHVWHCPVRTAPTDRHLSDAEWAEVARRIVAAAGIAPEGDEQACRWVAVRHAKDHIHIIATSVRADGRRPRSNRDGKRAQAECRKIEKELGLRQLNQGDGTAPKTPTGAERAKAERQGRTVTARAWLREQAHTAAAASRNEDDYFAILTDLGITVHTRIGPESGEVIGYSLSAPGDTAAGQPVKFGGSKLSPDLSIHRLRERFAAHPTAPLTNPPAHRGARPNAPSVPHTPASPAQTPTHTKRRARSPPSPTSSTPQPCMRPALPAPNCTPQQSRSTTPTAPRSAPTTRPATPCARPDRNSSTAPTTRWASSSPSSLPPSTWPTPPPAGTSSAATNNRQPPPTRPSPTYAPPTSNRPPPS